MILIIDNYDSFTYNLYQAIAVRHPDVVVHRHDKITVDEIKQLAPTAIVLSPGPGHPEQAGICIELIKALAPTTPLLGICLGHQAIGAAFGVKIVSARKILHGKTDLIFHNHASLYHKLTNPFTAGRYHSLTLEPTSLPSHLLVDATSHDGTIMAISHQHYPCFGLQFHPESILSPNGQTIIDNFLNCAETFHTNPERPSEHSPMKPPTQAPQPFTPPLDHALTKLFDGQSLTFKESQHAMQSILTTETTPEPLTPQSSTCEIKIATFLALMRAKGETVEEILGILESLHQQMTPLTLPFPLLDIVGTGGDKTHSINISTGSALLAAACGLPVAKHGNRAVTSLCGAADVLEALGLDIQLGHQAVVQSIQQHNFGFCFAPNFHQAFRRLKSVRQKLGQPTILNTLGPLLNPAQASHLMIGVNQPANIPTMAALLAKLQTQSASPSPVLRAFIVHCQGFDEVTTTGESEITVVEQGRINSFTLCPEQYGFKRCHPSALRGGHPKQNAHLLIKALRGEISPIADTLILNAGLASYLYGQSKTLEQGLEQAREILKQGKTATLIEQLVTFSQTHSIQNRNATHV